MGITDEILDVSNNTPKLGATTSSDGTADADPALNDPWRYAQSHSVPHQANKPQQSAWVEGLSLRTYKFRVRALYLPEDTDDGPASWGEWSPPSNPMLLPAPEGKRPVRRHVRKLNVNHTGGGFTAKTAEIERCVAW